MNETIESESNSDVSRFLMSINLVLIGLGVTGNSLCFVIFRFSHSFRNMPSMVYLSFVAVFDTLALFEWNLDHYTSAALSIELGTLSIAICRMYNYIQYMSLQTSALILSFMCIDRYVTVVAMPGSFLSKLPFRTNRTAFIWSTSIVLFTTLLNFHILITLGII